MTQNRPPPAFQEYAAQMLANRDFRILSPTERGVLWTIRLECWVNLSLPADAATLAKVLGFSSEEVARALPVLSPFLAFADGSITCPELDDYRAHLQAIHDKKAEGGKRGAAMTNGKRKGAETLAARSIDTGSGISRVSRGSLVKSSSVQSSKTQPLERDVPTDTWVSDYEAASNGS